MDPLFPQKIIFGTDSKPFKYPLNELYDPVFLVDVVKSSTKVEVKEEFRVDKAVQEIEHSSKYIKTVNIINGKEKGIFSYKAGDKIYAPEPSAISDVNAEYNNLSTFNKKVELESNITELFAESARKINQNISTSSANIMLTYVKDQNSEIMISSYEEAINKKYPNLL